MEDVKKKMEEELLRELEKMSYLHPADERFKDGANGVALMTKEYTALLKTQSEITTSEAEAKEARKRLIFDIANSLFHGVIEIGGIIVPIVFYHSWIQEGLRFEQNGSFCSSTFRTLLGKIKPGK